MILRGYVGPDFGRVGAAFDPDWPQRLLDFGEGVEVGLALVEQRAQESRSLRGDIAGFIAGALAAPDADLRGVLGELGMSFDYEGRSPRRALERLLERYESELGADAEVVEDVERDPLLRVHQRFPAPHYGTFTDEDTANEACTMVLRQHEPALRSWADATDNDVRQLMRADVGKPVGMLHADGREPQHTSYVSVLMAKTGDGRPFIRGAYPELTPDPRIAKEYPDLPQLFAGYFGQDWTANDGTPWNAEHVFQLGVLEPEAQRIRDQLDALLAATTTQAEIHHALTSLGSAILPAAARQWVARIRGRMDPTLWQTADQED